MTLTALDKLIVKTDFLKYSSAFFALSFTLGIAINSIAFFLFLFIGITITLNDMFKGKLKACFNQFNLILIAFFLIIAIREAVEHTSNISDVVYYYLSFLLLPLVIGFQATKMVSYLPIILKWFLIGCLVNACVNLGFAVYRGILLRDEGINVWYFTYKFLTEPFGIQPIYLSFFYVFALLILVEFKGFGKYKFFYYFSFSLLTFSIILLAARNAIFCMFILVPTYQIVVGKGMLKKILIITGLIGVCLVIAFQNPLVKNRILKVNKKESLYSGTSLRYSIWESAYAVSKENLLWGLGEKEANVFLLNEFEIRDLKVPLKYEYHAHSQYLQTLIHYGILGFFVLFAVFLWPLKQALAHKNFLAIFWLFLVLLTAISESIFSRQWGVFSFAFFSCLFLLKLKNSN